MSQINVWAMKNFQQYPYPEVFVDSGRLRLDSVMTYHFISETDSSLLVKEYYKFEKSGEITNYEGIKWNKDSGKLESRNIGEFDIINTYYGNNSIIGYIWKNNDWIETEKYTGTYLEKEKTQIYEDYTFNEETGKWILVSKAKQQFNKDEKLVLSNFNSYSYENGELNYMRKAEFTYTPNGKIESLKNFRFDSGQNSWNLRSNASYHYHQNQELDSMIMDQWHQLPDGEIQHRRYKEDYDVNLSEDRPNFIFYDWDTTSLSWQPFRKRETQKKEFESIEQEFLWESENNSWKNNSVTITELNEAGKNVRFERLSTNYNQEKYGNRKLFKYGPGGYKLIEENFDWDNDQNDWVIKEKKYYFYNWGELTNLEESITVYPNPAREELNIAMENPLTGDLLISVFDMQGRMLQNVKLEKEDIISTYRLDHLDISEGAYILKFDIGNHSAIKRFVRY
ncbi:T9SS type A sorting domain-containing protein [Flexithrix dorotheae]|uniref:T9SS type A sorting domain-containing protein n=1 Tax=Flexithrix dorotheae TaxID=70993 RepID=UPI00037DEA9F|nr:T9SS type A sorting domain-containing protein [Flexithrix dorotheae]